MEKNKKGNNKDNKKGGGGNNKKNNAKEDSAGGSDDKLKTCNFVKARHILCEKLSQIEEIYNTLNDQYGKCPPASEFGKLASEHSTCSSKKRGGELGYFSRTQMVGPFAEAAFSTSPGQMTDIIKTVHGYHIILVEDRKMTVK
jgi:hypothetical protein